MFACSTARLLKLRIPRQAHLLNVYKVTYSTPLYRIQTVSGKGLPQKQIANLQNFPRLRKLSNKIFGKYLLVTNIISSGLLMVVGDVVAQEIEYRRKKQEGQRYDLLRIGRMFVVGSLFGPLHHYVYNWMDRVMPIANFRNTMWKILIDQVFMSPVCILIFYYSACFLERKSLQETNEELIQKFPYIYLMDWLLWPGAQYYNFRYLNLKYRVMFVNICTALYDVLLSYMKHDVNMDMLLN